MPWPPHPLYEEPLTEFKRSYFTVIMSPKVPVGEEVGHGVKEREGEKGK